MLSLQPFQNGGHLLLFVIKAVCRQLRMISLLKRPSLFVKLETKTFKVKLINKRDESIHSLKTGAVLNNIRFFLFYAIMFYLINIIIGIYVEQRN